MASDAEVRLGFASTYAPQRCGIGAYTGQLARALVDVMDPPPIVLSEFGTHDGIDGGVRSIPTFRRAGDFAAQILEGARRMQANVIHIQHAPDIFGTGDRLVHLCRMLTEQRIASVVTLHTVHSWGTGAWRGYFNIPAFHRRLGEAAGALVVHGEARAAETLRAHGVRRNRVHVISFGTPAAASRDRTAARAQLGLPADAPILVCIGFLRRSKRLETLIRALGRLRRRIPGCLLILAGAVQNESWRERWYPGYLRALIRCYGLKDTVDLRQGFLSDEEVALMHAAADLVLLPYRQRYGSGSMALHTALAERRLAICSRIAKFDEVAHYLSADFLVPPGNAAAWAHAIESGLEQARAPATQARLEAFARATAWSRVASEHVALYQSIQYR